MFNAEWYTTHSHSSLPLLSLPIHSCCFLNYSYLNNLTRYIIHTLCMFNKHNVNPPSQHFMSSVMLYGGSYSLFHPVLCVWLVSLKYSLNLYKILGDALGSLEQYNPVFLHPVIIPFEFRFSTCTLFIVCKLMLQEFCVL